MPTHNKDTCNKKGKYSFSNILLSKDSGITLELDRIQILPEVLLSSPTTPMKTKREFKEWSQALATSPFKPREEHSPDNPQVRRANRLEQWDQLITDLITLRRRSAVFQETDRMKTVSIFGMSVLVSNRSWIDSNSDYQE